MKGLLGAAVALNILGTGLAMAQGLAGDITKAGGGADTTRMGSLLSGAQIQAAKGGSTASLKLSKVTSIVDAGGVATFNNFSITAAAPLNKAGGDSDIITLDGLASAASLEIAFSKFYALGKRRPPTDQGTVAKLDSICARVSAVMKEKTGKGLPADQGGCDTNLVEAYGSGDDYHAFLSAFWDLGNSARWLWGANAKVGHQEYGYIASTLAKKEKQNQAPWSVGLYGSVQPSEALVLILASAQYQHTFKEGTNGAVCPSSNGTISPSVCLVGPVDAPSAVTKKLLSLELRGNVAKVGLGFAVSRDLVAKATSVEIPIYLVADKDGKLSGGLKAGWRSDTKDSSLSVFVGVPFSLY